MDGSSFSKFVERDHRMYKDNNFDPHWDGDLLVDSLKASSFYRRRLEAGSSPVL